ncbi:non-ribosomal peptide synthetase [Patulibacter americanus]|uniref:non-ribosomal peptide synthetase n=1 Tax=Patulibacter americanus TaxID=588672 RepID=UPI0003B2EA22|nr:non-ribosomal peptide synthetase [Patulibacter americanus]
MSGGVAEADDAIAEVVPAPAPLLPLTAAQEGIWFAARLDPDGAAFVTAECLELRGDVDLELLARAVRTAVDEAEGLHVVLEEAGDAPLQRVAPPADWPLPVVDLRGEPDPDAAAQRWAHAAWRRPLDPATDRLFDEALLRVADDVVLWFQRVHHLAADATALSLLARRAAEIYGALLADEAPVAAWFPSLAATLEVERAYRASPAAERDAEHWRGRCTPAPRVTVLSDRPEGGTHEIHRASVPVGDGLRAALHAAGDATGGSWPEVVMAGVAAYVARMAATAGREDDEPVDEVVLGVPLLARLGPVALRSPATMVNVVPLRVPVRPDGTPADVVRAVTAEMRTTRRHQRHRGEELRRTVGALGRGRALYGPLVNVLPFDYALRFGDVAAVVRTLGAGPVDDLSFNLYDRGDAPPRIDVEANVARYAADDARLHAERIAVWLERFARAVVDGAAAADGPGPDAGRAGGGGRPEAHGRPTVGALDLLTPHERDLVLDGFNATDRPVDPSLTLVALMDRALREHPDREAVRCGDDAVTLAELHARAAVLADALRADGAGPGRIVAVAVPRSVDLLVALVGVLRSGAAYLPLDVDLPAGRLEAMLEDARPVSAVVAESADGAAAWDDALARRRPDATRVEPAPVGATRAGQPTDEGGQVADALRGSSATAEVAELPRCPEHTEFPTSGVENSARFGPEGGSGAAAPGPDSPPPNPVAPAVPPGPDDPAYVLYTSGSTGRPKGVVVPHHAIVNRLLWQDAALPIDAARGDRILQKTPVGFDVSVWELFWPLIAAVPLEVAPPGAHRDPRAIAALVARTGVTHAHFVPSMLGLFVDEPLAAECTGLRRIVCSGEALPPELRDRLRAVLPDTELHNLYGPTEAAVDVTHWPCADDAPGDPVPIGRPVWNTRTLVLDPQGRPVPIGATGELHLAGVQLADGYLGRPDLTDAAFVPGPLAGEDARMYKTGDLARWRPDGAIEYLGRRDHQVKIRGQRIETGEVEARLLEDPAVRGAAVIARDDGPGGTRLVAYLVPADATSPPALEAHALRRRLAETLSDAMVPSAFVVLDALPLTPSGKLDRRALPAPDDASTDGARGAPDGADAPPATLTEELVRALFAELLALPRVGPDDDFFLLGGHSLLAARAVARLREALGREVSIGTLFAAPTPSALALALEDEGDGGALDVVLPLRRGGDRPPLFCLHPAGGIGWGYAGLARLLPADQPVVALQARGLAGPHALPVTMDAMVDDYVARIREVWPTGPYRLLGWSVGGVIAQAITARLEHEGAEVDLLALLDAYPSDQWRDLAAPTEAQALTALLNIAGHDPGRLGDEPLTREGVVAVLREDGSALASLSEESLTAMVRIVVNNATLMRTHVHRPFGGDALFFAAGAPRTETWLDVAGWEPYVRGGLRVRTLECTHAQMLHAGPLREIASVLERQLSGAGGR